MGTLISSTKLLQDELPRKDERIVFCDPSPLQKAIYKHILQQPDLILLAQAHLPCMCGVNKAFFKTMERLESRHEKIDYFRKNRKNVVKRSECCFQLPTVSRNSSEIDPRAVLWRQQHPDDIACKRCPFCVTFPALTVLHKVSTHVSLILPTHAPESLPEGHGRAQAEKELEIAKAFIPPEVVEQLPGKSLIRQDDIMNDHFVLSGKMKVLARLLEIIERLEGRVLVFSASTSTLDLIEVFVQTTGYSFLRMDGSTQQKKRAELADEFKSRQDIFLFLLSTKAMGLGLVSVSCFFIDCNLVFTNPF